MSPGGGEGDHDQEQTGLAVPGTCHPVLSWACCVRDGGRRGGSQRHRRPSIHLVVALPTVGPTASKGPCTIVGGAVTAPQRSTPVAGQGEFICLQPGERAPGDTDVLVEVS